jgi:hypothetical protein
VLEAEVLQTVVEEQHIGTQFFDGVVATIHAITIDDDCGNQSATWPDDTMRRRGFAIR